MAENYGIRKRIKHDYIPGVAGVAASPGQPYLPARSAVVAETKMVYTGAPTYKFISIEELMGYGGGGPANYQGNYAAGNAYNPNYSGQSAGSGVLLPPGAVPVYGPAPANWPSEGGSKGAYGQNRVLRGYQYPVGGTGGWQQKTVYTTVNYPAQPYIPPSPGVPATPGQLRQNFNLGWNSGARTIKSIPVDGYFELRLPASPVDLFVGLLPDVAGDITSYADLPFAFRFSKGFAYVYESGQRTNIVGGESPMPAGTMIRIGRSRGKATLKVRTPDDPPGVFYDDYTQTPLAQVDLPDGPLHLFFVAYSGGDQVDQVSVSTVFGSSENVMRPLAGVSSDYAYSEVRASFEPMTTDIPYSPYANNTLQPLAGMCSDHAYGEVRGVMPAMTTVAYSGLLTPSTALCMNTLPFMTGVSSGLSGGTGEAVAEFLPLDILCSGHSGVPSTNRAHNAMRFMVGYCGISDTIVGDGVIGVMEPLTASTGNTVVVPPPGPYEYGESTNAFLPMVTSASGFEGATNGYMQDTVFAGDMWFVELEDNDTLVTEVTVGTTLLVRLIESGEVFTTLTVETEVNGVPTHLAMMLTTVSVGFDVPEFIGAANTYAMNLANAANSRYEGFNFNSYAKIDGEYYGASADGIFKLNGPDDAGQPIHASINFGNSSFGTSLLKGCTAAYIGVSSDYKLKLKLTINGKSYLYAARDFGEFAETQRFDIGRGVRANFLQFELISEGYDFDLRDVEFKIIPLSRRI